MQYEDPSKQLMMLPGDLALVQDAGFKQVQLVLYVNLIAVIITVYYYTLLYIIIHYYILLYITIYYYILLYIAITHTSNSYK
jgi:hypothetical protein